MDMTYTDYTTTRAVDAEGRLLSETQLTNGAKDGFERQYSNGQLRMSGCYDMGQRNGMFKTWHENGQIIYDAIYVKGREVSFTEYDKCGNITITNLQRDSFTQI